jgi:hypothetical protein
MERDGASDGKEADKQASTNSSTLPASDVWPEPPTVYGFAVALPGGVELDW